MKTAKQLRTGLVGEGEFIPNQATIPARELYEIHKELASLKSDRDELHECLKSILDLPIDYDGATVCRTGFLNKARAILKRTEPCEKPSK